MKVLMGSLGLLGRRSWKSQVSGVVKTVSEAWRRRSNPFFPETMFGRRRFMSMAEGGS